MIAMNIEVKVASISFDKRLIRYLKEFQINRSPIKNEVSCYFFLPLFSSLAFLIRCKGFDGLVKKYWFTLQNPKCDDSVTKEFTLSETDYEIGHVIAPNAIQTGLPSSNVDPKLFENLINDDNLILTVRNEKDGPDLATFNFKVIKSKSEEESMFSSEFPIRLAPHTASMKRTKAPKNEEEVQRKHKKLKRRQSKKSDRVSGNELEVKKEEKHSEASNIKGEKAKPPKIRSQSLPLHSKSTVKMPLKSDHTPALVSTKSNVTSTKKGEDAVKGHTISRFSIDRATPPEIIMQQEQRELLRELEETIELITNDYEKEKEKIDVKMRKLEKSRKENKKAFKQNLLDLQRAKIEAQDKLKWIILNTSTIEVDTSDHEKETEQTPAVISDSENQSGSGSEVESHRSATSSPTSSAPEVSYSPKRRLSLKKSIR